MNSNQHGTIYYQAPPPCPASLLIIENNKSLRTIILNGETRIGHKCEEVQNDIELESKIASRNHGTFFFVDGMYYYRDNNSLNGTYYNGEKLKSFNERGSKAVMLKDGDVLRIDCRTLNTPHPEAVIMIFSTSLKEKNNWHRVPLQGKKAITIGRNPDNTICLNDFMTSSHHATLELHLKKWKITDNHSKNGVAVNRSMINGSHVLAPFDVIRICNTTLILLEKEIIYHDTDTKKFAYSERNLMMRVDLDSVKAGKKFLLKDIHLDIETGDFTLVLGGAGAGKSTLIKAITGQDSHALRVHGTVYFEGMDLYKNLPFLKRKIGIVPQFPDFRFEDTVYNTILDSAKLQLSGDYSSKEIKERVEQVIENMMLQKIRNSMLSVISGGQRKRVQVAMKAVGDISFFTFDEPDAGLDIAGRIKLVSEITTPITMAPITKEESEDNTCELSQCIQNGCAGLMISHYPDDVASMYKKVIVLAKSKEDDVGRLAFYGDVQSALDFFEVEKLSDIVIEINDEGGKGRGDEFVRKFKALRSE